MEIYSNAALYDLTFYNWKKFAGLGVTNLRRLCKYSCFM